VLIEGLRKKPTDIHVTIGLDPRSDAGMCDGSDAIGRVLRQVQRATPAKLTLSRCVQVRFFQRAHRAMHRT
jgi:hypothetical protein